MRDFTLRQRLVALLVTTVAALSAVVVVVLPGRLERISREWAESRALGIARVVGGACEPPLDFDDAVAAGEILARTAAARDAVYAALYRADGSLLARRGPVAADAPRGGAREGVTSGGDLIHAAVPVATRIGGTGTLVLGFGEDEFEARVAEVRRTIYAAVAVLLALVAVPALAFGTVVIRPLDRIAEVARRIAGGDLSAREGLDLRRRDEVGALARALDAMLQRLFEKEASLRALAEDLERRVAERTAELGRTNEALAGRVDELTRAQQQLIVADRRVSVGRLAAGVAHEINNPLAFIDANLSYLAEALGDLRRQASGTLPPATGPILDEMAGAVADARQGSQRVRHIVRGLKNFSRGDEDPRAPVSLEAAAGAALDMAAHEAKHRARVVRRFERAPLVDASEVRLAQVILNLVVNAAQAIPVGHPDDHEIRVRIATAPDGWAILEVSDTGCGMTREVRERLFEPFFTTKRRDEGTGLGLPVSRGIVEGYGGTIEVESAPGRGSTFRIRLPPSAGAPAAGAPLLTPVPPSGPRRRLLIVDDEAMVAAGLQRSLRRHLDVVAVASGEAALDLLARGERFDAILCDLIMPGMSGVEVRAALRARFPAAAAHALFMTGGALDPAGEAFLADPGVTCLEKPVDADTLRRLVDAMPT